MSSCEVGGLESGDRYRADVTQGSLMEIWWRWGTREEIMIEPGSLRRNLTKLASEQAPLGIGQEIEGVEFSVEWNFREMPSRSMQICQCL